MASTAKCPFCGAVVTSDQQVCPECGAKNESYVEDQPRRITNPKTIDELKEYCAERGMPLLRMRFFIGENFKEPRAFGIYRSGDVFTVYKNKADGSRSIRYSGPDEAYAVRELFAKLLDECHNRGIYPDGKPAQAPTRSGSGGTRNAWDSERSLRKKKSIFQRPGFLIGLVIVLIASAIIINLTNDDNYKLKKGYYLSGSVLYHYGSENGFSSWHLYNGEWEKANNPFKTNMSAASHYKGEEYKADWNADEISFPDKPLPGYYAYQNELYCYQSGWHYLDPEEQNWNYNKNLNYDSDGHMMSAADYFLGEVYQPEWIGCEYPFKEGYYRYKDATWYYSKATERWYKYDQEWQTDTWPVNNFSSCYAGTVFSEAWGGVPNPVADGWKKGYYRYQKKTYYYAGKYWYQSTTLSGSWSMTFFGRTADDDHFLLCADDYYEGTSFQSAWGGKPYAEKGYYRYGGNTYYYTSGSWHIYQNNKWMSSSDFPDSACMDYYEGTSTLSSWKVSTYGSSSSSSSSSGSQSSWDSDWDSSDYDSWDSSDTDWDSDW